MTARHCPHSEGDRCCLDRRYPGFASLPGSYPAARKDSPVAFDLPEMKTLNDAVPAMGALVKAVGQGDLTPTEAGELTKMVQAFAKSSRRRSLKSAFENWKRRLTNDAGKPVLKTGSVDFAQPPAEGRDDLGYRDEDRMRHEIATSQPIPRTGMLPSWFSSGH